MEENKKESRTQSLKEQSGLGTQQCSHLSSSSSLVTEWTWSSWAYWMLPSWLVSDGWEVLSSEWALSAHGENRLGRRAWRCQRNHKYFIMLNQMEKAKIILFQMEVVETSSHSRLIGTLPSHQSLETKPKKRAAETVKHIHEARAEY